MSDDDLEEGIDLDEASCDEFEKKEGTLGDLWRDNPLVKVGVVVAAAVAIFGTIILFGGEEAPVDLSYVPQGSTVSAPPGTEEATPAYIDAIQEETEARIEEAQRTGGSALPTPIEPPVLRATISSGSAGATIEPRTCRRCDALR